MEGGCRVAHRRRPAFMPALLFSIAKNTLIYMKFDTIRAFSTIVRLVYGMEG